MRLVRRLLRPGPFAELQGILVLSLLLAGIGVAVGIATAFGGTLRTTIPSDHVLDVDSLTGLRDGATLDRHGDVGVAVSDPSVGQSVLAVLTWLPTAVVILGMLALLVKLVWHARRDGPFTAATVRSLRLLGVLAGGGLLAWAGEFMAQFALADTVSEAGPAGSLLLGTPVAWVLVGGGYLVVAEVVDRGLAMRAELDEVI